VPGIRGGNSPQHRMNCYERACRVIARHAFACAGGPDRFSDRGRDLGVTALWVFVSIGPRAIARRTAVAVLTQEVRGGQG
jgi:hypothetical protein